MHACAMGYQMIFDDFLRYSGYLEYGASNDIIIVFP